MQLSKLGKALSVVVMIIGAAPLLAADSAKTPEEIFKDKGLIKVGFMLIVPQEQELHDAVVKLRTVKGKLAAAAAKIRDADAKIKAVERSLKAMEDEDRELNVKMAAGQADNQMIGRHNLLADSINSTIDQLNEMGADRQKLLMSKSDYITATLDASEKANAVLHAYDAPRADKELTDAIDTYNLTARPRVKLGPSASLEDDLDLLKKCNADVTSGIIPITLEHGVPNVEVLINGKVTETMIWDSGCTDVTLSAKTASDLGLHPSNKDPIIDATIADGSHIKQHVMMLDSIRIGPYTVVNVQCTIAAKGTQGADLLGNEFQHLFAFKLDVNASTLQLTPLETQALSSKTTEKPAPPPTADAPVKPVQKSANPLAGDWFEPSTNITIKLNDDLTAQSDDKQGKWVSNREGTLIAIVWKTGGMADTLRLSHGKWTRYSYQNGTLKTSDEISPP